MITTRFGGEVVKVSRIDFKSGEADFTVKNEDGSTEDWKSYLYELRADEGIKEITAAAGIVEGAATNF